MRRVTSLSALGRERLCSGAAIVPRIRSHNALADVGSAVHEWIALAVGEAIHVRGNGPLEDIADRWELWGDARDRFFRCVRGLAALPVPQEGLTEVPLMMLEDGTVEPAKGGRGEYQAPDNAILAGTIDAFWAERDGRVVPFEWDVSPRAPEDATLIVTDWKTGAADHVPPPAFNWQLKGGALLAARWTGATRVLPMLGLIDGGPIRWETEQTRDGYARVLGENDIAEIETEVRRVAARARAASEPEFVTGTHCSYCPARFACPAHIAAPRAMVEMVPEPKAIAPLTDAQARRLLPIVMAVEPARKAAMEALKWYALVNGPISLPDGRQWGPSATRKATFETESTFEALVAALAPYVGQERAEQIAHGAFETSRQALWDAVSEAVDPVNRERQKRGEKRVTKKSVAEPMFAALAASGAMVEHEGVEFEARWPKESS